MSPIAEPTTIPAQAFLPLIATDHIEFYVGNARQAAHFYETVLGFQLTAYQGPESGIHDRASYVMQQGEIRLVLTTALRPNHPIADHVYKHGDAVRSIAISVDDAKACYSVVKQRGARIVQEPTELRDEGGVVRVFAIAAYGDTIHTFVDRSGYGDAFLPGYAPVAAATREHHDCGLFTVDHMAATVRSGEIGECVSFYRDVLGFDENWAGDAAVMSKLTADGERRLEFPIQEPSGAMQPHVEEYLDSHQGPGVQCIALACADLTATVSKLRARGLEFADGGDRICTRPVSDRPTLFFEIVERSR
jgi:4-hydroxyphenylpyruvate dioxygenase